MGNPAVDSWRIADTDAHITEPADLWTSRVPKKYVDLVPHAAVNPNTGHRHWRLGDTWYWPVAGGSTSQAGWHEFLPSQPWEYEEADPAAYSATDRLQRMNEYGIDVQAVYPNIVGFVTGALMRMGTELSVMVTRAYNDFMLEWCSADPTRLIPMAAIPYWDIDASLAEMERCVNLGFKGVLFANKFEKLGLPSFVSDHWDPIYAAAQDYDIPINFHILFGGMDDKLNEDMGQLKRSQTSTKERRDETLKVSAFLEADNLIGQILVSDLCVKFPKLKLVSVETGFGHFPFYLEALDWYWKMYGNESNENKSRLLPSEYFRRQCYGTYWFEQTTLRVLDLYPDNFMFSTDFPHGTSLAPGPCGGTSLMPSEYVKQTHGALDPVLRDKALFGNAAAIYKFDAPARSADFASGRQAVSLAS